MGDTSPSYPYVAVLGAGAQVLAVGAVWPLHEAMPGLPDAGPSRPQRPHRRAQPGPAAKMAAPHLWENGFKKGQNAAQRREQHREHQGQRRRRCPKAEQGESLRKPSGEEKLLCTDHNHSLILPALLWAVFP